MDFVVGLPRTSKGYNSIWVIVDGLTKSAHFIPVDTKYTAKKYVEIYFDRIVTLQEFPLLSSLIKGQFLSLIFGSDYRNVLVLVSSEAQHIIHKLMAKLEG